MSEEPPRPDKLPDFQVALYAVAAVVLIFMNLGPFFALLPNSDVPWKDRFFLIIALDALVLAVVVIESRRNRGARPQKQSGAYLILIVVCALATVFLLRTLLGR